MSKSGDRKKRFSAGRRVLVGFGRLPATVLSVADSPSVLGEFAHEVKWEGTGEIRKVLGCDIHPLPGLDEDLPRSGAGSSVQVSLHNSTVGNLNLGSQVGTITTVLSSISAPDSAAFTDALRLLTNALVADPGMQEGDKREVLEALTTLAEEGAKKPEERKMSVVKAVTLWLPQGLAAANNLLTLWEKVGPVVKAHLGL